MADTVVVSNRGPGHAAGGLVVVLGPGVRRSGARWIAADSVEIDLADHAGYYDVIANGTLWYLTHGLWDRVRRPRFDRRWHQAWDSYRRVNERFALAVADAAAPGATVNVQDYHLALVAGMLAETRPDLQAATFIHTPWCAPDELAVLPDNVARELVGTLAAGGPVGFHSGRWAERFAAGAAAVGVRGPVRTFVAPAAGDVAALRQVAASTACQAAADSLDEVLDGRRFIVRVDRIEPSKNVLRGLWAFDALLGADPSLAGTVTFGVFVYPSRLGLADYQAYGQEITTLVEHLNAKWATPGWTPILLDATDDHVRSVAALRRYDALLVNPVRDGLNLVALEGPAVNERDGMVVLSAQAGCADFLADAALVVNPFDEVATAEALGVALTLTGAERAERAASLRAAAVERTPLSWWDAVMAATAHR